MTTDTPSAREKIASIKADPGDGTVAPDLAHVLARGFDAMGWGMPQHAAEDMIDAIAAVIPSRERDASREAFEHDWNNRPWLTEEESDKERAFRWWKAGRVAMLKAAGASDAGK